MEQMGMSVTWKCTLVSWNKHITYHFLLLLGKERDSDPDKGLAHKVVMNLVEGLEGKGYHIFTDN